MLVDIARQLDNWLIERNFELRADGLRTYPPCEIRVVGQAALLESELPLRLAATRDVDVSASYEFPVEQQFRRLLEAHGRELDPVGHEAWMPRETTYTPAYSGQFVTLLIADPDSVLVSKALKAPVKNRPLITEYLARGASERFFELALRYAVDLEQFV